MDCVDGNDIARAIEHLLARVLRAVPADAASTYDVRFVIE